MLSAFNAKALASIGVWMGRGRGRNSLWIYPWRVPPVHAAM